MWPVGRRRAADEAIFIEAADATRQQQQTLAIPRGPPAETPKRCLRHTFVWSMNPRTRPIEAFTLRRWLWAGSVMSSRQTPVKGALCLVPLWDLLDHDESLPSPTSELGDDALVCRAGVSSGAARPSEAAPHAHPKAAAPHAHPKLVQRVPRRNLRIVCSESERLVSCRVRRSSPEQASPMPCD
jgi:hypothetical protein